MASVGLPKVNGSAAQPKQTLSGVVSFFKLDVVDALDMSNVGFTGGNAGPGEKAIQGIATAANPVLWDVDNANTRIVHFAVEVPGFTAAALQTAVRTVFANATVVAGNLTVA